MTVISKPRNWERRAHNWSNEVIRVIQTFAILDQNGNSRSLDGVCQTLLLLELSPLGFVAAILKPNFNLCFRKL